MLSSPMRGSMPGSPTRSHEPLIRGIAGLLEVSKPPPLETCQWEMDPWISAPGHRDGRQRVYSMPSSPTSMPSSPTPSREGRGREQLKLQSDTSLVGLHASGTSLDIRVFSRSATRDSGEGNWLGFSSAGEAETQARSPGPGLRLIGTSNGFGSGYSG
eukprot:3548482-Rhodomonas_salina.1